MKADTKKSKHTKLCPVCRKTDQVIPIIYGSPSFELWQESKKGTVRLGGCCISSENPEWYCKRDEIEF